MSIYERAVRALRSEGLLKENHSAIVTCGGPYDAAVLSRFGIAAVITNLDDSFNSAVSPHRWQRADAEALPFPDDSFDWGFVHAGLHHCRVPHQGLAELLRVARRGVLVVEARDSLLMRLAVRLGLTGEYELEDVAVSGAGGLRNGGVPNFVYRWTEREARKAVESALPDTVNDLRFWYGARLPGARLRMYGPGKRACAAVLGLAARALFAIAPKQGNLFAFAVLKTGQDKPWIERGTEGPALASALDFDPGRYVRDGEKIAA